jgi:poly-gamma-glutamate synthesis protein (capsule biosynthesis protein)
MSVHSRSRPRHAAAPTTRIKTLRIALILGVGAIALAAVLVAERMLSDDGSLAASDGALAAATASSASPATTAPDSAGSSSPAATAPASAASASAPSTAGSASVPTTAASTTGAARPVTIAFGGDVHFEGFLRERLGADPDGMLASAAPMLTAADVAIVNLETAVTERGEPEGKTYTFRAPESAYTALAAAGIDVVSVGNNHSLDFGEVGLLDTLDAAERHGIASIGGGRDRAEAYGAHHVEVGGRRIAILAATQVLGASAYDRWVAGDATPGIASAKPPYLEYLVEAVRVEAQRSDIVVVVPHWGIEVETCPTGDQQALARQLVDAGADVVVGGHAHRLQGGGRLGDAVVHYGLGNLVFYKQAGPATHSGVFEVTIEVDGSLSYRWVPALLQGGVAAPLQGAAAQEYLASWERLRACTDLSP